MRHDRRLNRLRALLQRPLLVSNLVNVRYLTGFSGSNAFLAVWPDRSVFVTDARYGEAAAVLVDGLEDCELVVYRDDVVAALAGLFAAEATVDVEADAMTWDMVRRLGEAGRAEPVAVTGTVEQLRITKDADEVAALERAASVGDGAFGALGQLMTAAASESDLGWRLVAEMRARGAGTALWDPIVASGAHASIPHYRSGNHPVGTGLLLLDYGCVVEGYHSDMSRTVWVDGDPPAEMVRIHKAVLDAQEEALQAVAPGVTADEVDASARRVLAGYGYEEQFLHSTGHGVGLQIHEEPWVRRGSETVLQPGHVITVEPGVYLPGVGGVRIEDMVLVDDDPQVLTHASKDMVWT